ncbi:macrolide transporter ATP-binding /permease protein [compost metagenome]
MILLKQMSEKFNQTIVMITHNEAIAQTADRIIRIEDGRIVSGSPAASGATLL